MEFKEAGGSVCVFVYVYTLDSARALHPCAEQGTTRVVSARKTAIQYVQKQ